ncbi:MAG TPA: hypothetical protein ENF36_09385, partial [Desulfobacteraceae bacterium]|nr:hypothetical protein [Desulfobacteraceae bacterium]
MQSIVPRESRNLNNSCNKILRFAQDKFSDFDFLRIINKYGQEIRMSIEIDNSFPVMAIPIPKANALHKEYTSSLPPKNPQ